MPIVCFVLLSFCSLCYICFFFACIYWVFFNNLLYYGYWNYTLLNKIKWDFSDYDDTIFRRIFIRNMMRYTNDHPHYEPKGVTLKLFFNKIGLIISRLYYVDRVDFSIENFIMCNLKFQELTTKTAGLTIAQIPYTTKNPICHMDTHTDLTHAPI